MKKRQDNPDKKYQVPLWARIAALVLVVALGAYMLDYLGILSLWRLSDVVPLGLVVIVSAPLLLFLSQSARDRDPEK